jgi:lysophospholipase L1-like esterase
MGKKSNVAGARGAKSSPAKIGPRKQALFVFVAALIFLLLAEGLCAVALRLAEKQWPYTRPKSANYLLFEPHPDWCLTPRKNADITVLGNRHHHNADGFRGKEFSKTRDGLRMVCIGGSTTYCVGVADDQTWPFYLEELLPAGSEVRNCGVPGHSSEEHKKMLPVILQNQTPDVVFFQMGLNDLRSMNVTRPGAHYENFHEPSLRFAAGAACRRDRLPPVALVHAATILLEKFQVLKASPFSPDGPPGKVSDLVDARIVETFSANLDALLRECRSHHVRAVLLPHALSPEMITETNYKWWVPFLTKQGIFNAEAALNAVMRAKADGRQVIYAGFLDGQIWTPGEFCDPTHLNPSGNRRLARMLHDQLPWAQLPAAADSPAAR